MKNELWLAGTCLVALCGVAGPSAAEAQDWTLAKTLARSDAGAVSDAGSPLESSFGIDVALDSQTILVGAVEERDVNGTSIGAVYAYSGADFSRVQRLTTRTPKRYDGFGFSLGVSGDHAVIGSLLIDHAFVSFFVRENDVWREQQRVDASGPAAGLAYGRALAIEGDRALVSASAGQGRVFAYKLSNGVWTETQQLTPSIPDPQDYFGLDVGLSGDTAVISAPGNAYGDTSKSATYVFVRTGESWVEQARLTYPEAGGPPLVYCRAVAIDGETLIAGATPGNGQQGNGRAVVWVRQNGSWSAQQVLSVPGAESFGTDVSLSGDVAFISGRTGKLWSAYVFTRAAGVWSLRDTLVANEETSDSNGALAVSLGIGVRGGASNKRGGAAYVYRSASSSDVTPRDASVPDAAVPADASDAATTRDASADPSAAELDASAGSGAPSSAAAKSDGCSLTTGVASSSPLWWLGLACLLGRRRRQRA